MGVRGLSWPARRNLFRRGRSVATWAWTALAVMAAAGLVLWLYSAGATLSR